MSPYYDAAGVRYKTGPAALRIMVAAGKVTVTGATNTRRVHLTRAGRVRRVVD